ncbi:MAG: hypothetical protein IKV66_14120 [Clostridia bacterium]|nr:hypothetical protein [Clostridia bacterium]
MTYSDWNGFKRLDFTFEDRRAILVFPKNEGFGTGHWACKMEYFGAFPQLECELLENGFHLAYMENKNRWGCDVDHDARVRFADYLKKEYGLSHKFIPVGMSCGGLHSVNFASRYPDRVSVLYLDAPVMNLLSCPMGFGVGGSLDNGGGWQELVNAYGFTISSLLTYREHPIDRIPTLIAHKLPVALVYGDSDTIVPYIENGKVLEDAYRKTDLPLYCVGKADCGHHPHGLEDNGELLAFIAAQIQA